MNQHFSYPQGSAVRLSRRQLLRTAAGVGIAGAGLGLLASCGDSGASPAAIPPDAPPETTRLTLAKMPGLCLAPQFVAEELLRTEGFTDIIYHPTSPGTDLDELLATGRIQLAQNFVVSAITRIEAGDPIVILGGLHAGCAEVFATDRVRSIRDLNGRTVAVPWLGAGPQLMLATMAAYVGLDPHRDITWEAHPPAEAIELLATGKVDAYPAIPPDPQALRARGIGHVVLDTGHDRPWSQYYCCVQVADREFVRRNPVAAKRAFRAILKAADLCANAPDIAAQALVNSRIAAEYDVASRAMHDILYNRWREYEPEDTIRFHSLRLKEIGAIRSSPNEIIRRGTDFRIFNEIKKELKA